MASRKEHRKVLGDAIRVSRKKLGISQEQLAEIADLHHNYIGELERGEKAATIDSIVKIAKALRVNVRDLLFHL